MDDMIVLKKAINKRKQITGLKKCENILKSIFFTEFHNPTPLSFEEKFLNHVKNENIRFILLEKTYSDNKWTFKLLSEYTGATIIINYTMTYKY